MHFKVKQLALAASVTAGILYLACAAFVALWPATAMTLVGWLAHVVNVEKYAGDVAITAGGVFWGLIEVFVYSYVAAWIFGTIYNRFTTK